jgi:hypothetical protein
VRLIKIFSLVAMAVMAWMAFIGGASAYAVDQEVVLCTLNVLLCPGEPEMYNNGQAFLMTGGSTAFVGGFNEECKESDVKGKTLAIMGTTMPVDLTSMAFSGCKPCIFITVKAMGIGKIVMNGDGTFLLTVPIQITYDSCIEKTKCVFSGKAVELKIENTEGGSPKMIAEKEGLTLVEGSALFCGESTSWSGSFTTSEPSPVYLSLYEL